VLALAAVYGALAADAWLCSSAFAAKRLRPMSLDGGGGFSPAEEPSAQADASPAPGGGRSPYQNIHQLGKDYRVEYGFENFNKDYLKTTASFDVNAVAASIREFGFREHDLEILDRWYQEVQDNAINRAKRLSISGRVSAANQAELAEKLEEAKSHNADIQARLDAELKDLAQEYRRRRQEVYSRAGFRYKGKNVIEVDIPALVSRSAPRVRSLAEAFARIAAQRSYESEDLVGAVASMAQTAMRYEEVDLRDGARVDGGVLPPLKALVMGQGDCDTKSAVIASVLKNWPNLRMVGLEIPDHYLMAVHRIPRRGEAYVEFQGLPYVMIEAAGPAWLAPGSVGEYTENFIQSGKDFQIQQL